MRDTKDKLLIAVIGDGGFQMTQAELTTAVNESRIQEGDVAELLQAISDLRNNLPAEHTAANMLQSLSPIIDDPKANVSNRLKVTLPIIPFLLLYEGEYELSSGVNLRAILQRVAEKIRF